MTAAAAVGPRNGVGNGALAGDSGKIVVDAVAVARRC